MFSIKTKQVAGVTLIVGAAVILLSGWYISSLAGIWLTETQARAELLWKAIYNRAFDVVLAGGDPVAALQSDGGLRSILQASLYDPNVQYASVVDNEGQIIAHSDPDSVGRQAPAVEGLSSLLAEGPSAQARAIYTKGGKSFELRKPLLLGEREFGSVRVGISTLFLRQKLDQEMKTPLVTTAVAILIASLTAMLLAQLTVRPIHVLRTGLARLGRGELDVSVDLPEDAELSELGESFRAVTARLAADRSELAGQRATLESVVENLEDAVALFSPTGALLFANPAMRIVLGAAERPLGQLLPPSHPYRLAVETTMATGAPLAPTTVRVPGGGERLVLAHPVADPDGQLLGVLLLARNLTYLTQVESTLSYSRKLAALSRLSAGIAHEVKNPLNATMIHLELLKMQVSDSPGALEHVAVIAAQVRRLDEVVQGFLKFTRPEDLQLQPVDIGPLVEDIMPVIAAEAGAHHVDVRLEFPADLPPASADSGLLQQAFLNLALNACQAMPNGGRLRIAGALTPDRRIQITFEDNGVGMPPDYLDKIFDLYFTTREHGSGIGLSLVYRTVQLHDGEIEVSSVPGRGTTFRVLLREAPVSSGWTRDGGILGLREAGSFNQSRPASRS
ncbi:MAG: ATP-binding protein [Vicinamibacterales bacterium]